MNNKDHEGIALLIVGSIVIAAAIAIPLIRDYFNDHPNKTDNPNSVQVSILARDVDTENNTTNYLIDIPEYGRANISAENQDCIYNVGDKLKGSIDANNVIHIGNMHGDVYQPDNLVK